MAMELTAEERATATGKRGEAFAMAMWSGERASLRVDGRIEIAG